MFFRKKAPKFSKEQALAAKPVRVVQATLTPTEKGGSKISVPIKTKGFAGFMFRMPEGAKKSFELDEIGVLVWESCDGKTSVQQIIKKLAKQYNLNLREAEVPTLKFLETLVQRGLVGMSVPELRDEK